MNKCKCGNPAKVDNECWCCFLGLTEQKDVPLDEDLELSLRERERDEEKIDIQEAKKALEKGIFIPLKKLATELSLREREKGWKHGR